MSKHRIGVISDTHGILRSEAVEALRGSDIILHAGDIGRPCVLEELRAIAPVTAVRGNIDKGEWAEALPEHEIIQIGEVSIYMLHDVKEFDINLETDRFQVVISGHSHKPLIQEQKRVLFINPGSAGPKRFKLPVSIALITISGAKVSVQIVELEV